uniref:Ig-like domain-containing protein n=1 Tax=Gouania willdenowi TaxID=441366 RepID=A0A8C5E8W6_GOUWI
MFNVKSKSKCLIKMLNLNVTGVTKYLANMPINWNYQNKNSPSVRMSVVPTSSKNSALTLYCDVENFYPEEVSVSWFQNYTKLAEDSLTEQNPDGTYRTRRYYTLSPEQRAQRGKVQCAVSQPGDEIPVNVSGDLDELDPQGFLLTRLCHINNLFLFSLCHTSFE